MSNDERPSDEAEGFGYRDSLISLRFYDTDEEEQLLLFTGHNIPIPDVGEKIDLWDTESVEDDENMEDDDEDYDEWKINELGKYKIEKINKKYINVPQEDEDYNLGIIEPNAPLVQITLDVVKVE